MAFIASNVNKHFQQINKNLQVNLKLIPNGFRTNYRPKDKRYYSKQICNYNLGGGFAIMSQKGFSHIKVKEIQCAADSEAIECVHEYTWDPAPPFLEKLKSWFFFRVKSQSQIISHMQESHDRLQSQYKQIQSL